MIAALTALTSPNAPTGSRAVSTQLSLALSDLAIQMPEWENVVQGMIDQFGSDARTVGVLLGFLKCLVEESGNPRIAISVCSLLTSTTPVPFEWNRRLIMIIARRELIIRANRLGQI